MDREGQRGYHSSEGIFSSTKSFSVADLFLIDIRLRHVETEDTNLPQAAVYAVVHKHTRRISSAKHQRQYRDLEARR